MNECLYAKALFYVTNNLSLPGGSLTVQTLPTQRFDHAHVGIQSVTNNASYT